MDMGKTFTTFMSFVLAAGGITFFLLDEYQKLAIFFDRLRSTFSVA